MNDDEKKKLQQKIVVELEKVRKDIEALRETVKPIPPDNAIGRLSRMEAISTKHINEATLRDAETRKINLEWSLGRLDSPGFGICRVCDEPIAMGRLLLMPETSCCIQCAANNQL